MATIALSVVGFVVGGPFGAQIGAMVGGVIDSFIFAPTIKGPRLTDLTVQSSSYGAPIPLLYGNRVRIAGQVVWSTDLIETKTTKRAGKGGPKQTTYSYRASIAVLLSGNEIAGITRGWANGKILFESSVPVMGTGGGGGKTHSSDVWGSATVYPGNGAQTPDPTIQSYLGAGNTPAFRHSAYVVIKDLQLADFGNAIPNLEFEIAPQPDITVGEVMRDLCTRAAATIYSSGPLSMPMDGFAVAQAQNVIAALQPLALAYGFDIAEVHGQMRVRMRGISMSAVLPNGMRSVREADGSTEAQPRGELATGPAIEMPRSATVSYLDRDANYQVGSQTANREQGADQNNIAVEIPLSMSGDLARRIADRVLWGAWAGRRSTNERVDDRWCRTDAGDVVGVPMGDLIMPMRLMRSQRGDNGVIEWQMQFEDPEVYRSAAIGGSFTPIIPYMPPPGESVFIPMDAPMLQSTDDDEGFYWAVGPTSDGWRGARVYRSSDEGLSFGDMDTADVPATMGTASALPAGPADFWDRGNVLTVALLNPDLQLESVTEDEVLNGRNYAWLGKSDGQNGEFIQFATADLIGPGVYELSDLLRGRRGTEYAIEGHGTDEYLVLLEPDAVKRANYGAGDWDRVRQYKAVSILLAIDDVESQDFTNSGETKRPAAPVHIAGVRDGADNLTITWVRRTRLIVPGLGLGPVPLGEETEAYEVDVIVASNPVRTIASTTPSASYSAADQTADGITPGDPVELRVYQLSTIRGRGHAGEALI